MGRNIKPKCLLEEGDTIRFQISDASVEQRIATTHNAPLGKRTSGWSKDSPVQHEPGWRGRITIKFTGKAYNKRVFDCDHLKKIGICTGSGGGGPDTLGYDLTLFMDDFPKLRRLALLNEIRIALGQPELYGDITFIEPTDKIRRW